MKREDVKTFDDFMAYTVEKDPTLSSLYATNDIIIDVVHQIVEQRKKLGLSQRELAKQAGIKQPVLARLESFRSTPNLETIAKLLHPLGMKLSITNA